MLPRARAYVRQNHLALLALMVAVAGVPTAWALGQNTVGSKELKPNSVGKSEHKDNSVGSAEVRNASLLSEDLGCEGNDAADEMVQAGPVCIDKFEASVWTQADGGTQLTNEAAIDSACPNNGQGCEGTIFARSVAGVQPARDITWFQALAALANSGKRFPSNAEWQLAATDTPGNPPAPGSEDCNTASVGIEVAGERANCESRFGARDMVGNVAEWVGDWDEQGPSCSAASGGSGFEGDRVCFGGSATGGFPAGLVRGGDGDDGQSAGVMSVGTNAKVIDSSSAGQIIGFRGAR